MIRGGKFLAEIGIYQNKISLVGRLDCFGWRFSNTINNITRYRTFLSLSTNDKRALIYQNNSYPRISESPPRTRSYSIFIRKSCIPTSAFKKLKNLEIIIFILYSCIHCITSAST